MPTENSPTSQSRKNRLGHVFASVGLAYALLACALGLAGGVGLFTFGYGQGASYLSNDPAACTNCHVMQDYFDTWGNSSHHHVAVCNDCHLSHHPIGKWVTKADNGFFHSLAFTLDNYHKPIRIKPRNRVVTQNACTHCHEEIAHQTLFLSETSESEPFNCVRCHSDVGHAFK
ncbi:cytochrome c nitrite reductase small subunit [Pelagicoccus sp. SDUM812003]|uniref:cytochrome c nitrite reductase small subunit n=1 Tax=Pelagicoccus sp. SDUM812003 TaxID=3041267 RepID=UPI00280D3131|nr:cytochrome c nitrite reductase small subunit [Pelagicoccus sp. SDUM812003]MDQ8204495.1 cytochrome c nitrite reductase small subunit [Pelagicoccus sp. SDUM812003]